jgi:predicted SprT family Zn-dependent metalloprotease
MPATQLGFSFGEPPGPAVENETPNPAPTPGPAPKPAPEAAAKAAQEAQIPHKNVANSSGQAPSEEEVERLSANLEAALIHELLGTYADLCRSLFRGKMKPAAIRLRNGGSKLGLWIPRERTIEIARWFVMREPWSVVVEVLKHEMAHQYVNEVLGVIDETPHGSAFRELCGKLGIDARAAGMPGAQKSDADKRVLERIAKLLALAESPNQNEAEAAMSAAQRLMLKHNLDTQRARSALEYGFRTLGDATGRTDESQRIVGGLLAKHFFVQAIWIPVYDVRSGKRGMTLEVCGTPANLEMAAYVHAFLHHTAKELWARHKRDKGIGANRDRRTFESGVMIGFLEKLDGERKAHAKEGLVWLKDGDLDGFYRARHPNIRTMKSAGTRRNQAHHEGREAGKRIVLHKPVTSGPSNSTPLLPGK